MSNGAIHSASLASGERLRLRLTVSGSVQGVGFRPFVYRLAREMSLSGWVNNSARGVVIEVEGTREDLDEFRRRVEFEKPLISTIQSIEGEFIDPLHQAGFDIRASEAGEKTTVVLPDLATCPQCVAEVFDPSNRRYRYPFTNCTNCGPRFTIIEGIPYDRPFTSMRHFTMCDACRAEYENPEDRRFHAQPNACPECGPHVELWGADGSPISSHDNALRFAAAAVRSGRVVALKGLGGFHLLVDAANREAIEYLRLRKSREEKPLALMVSSLQSIRELCEVSSTEQRLLDSPQSPIVLLRRRPAAAASVADNVAAGNPCLGIMLPYTPLHHLLMAEIGRPVVATSGNRSEEPICTDEREALDRLHGIADLFLVHNRPIVRHVDDSIVCMAAGRPLILRRSRGYAPLPVVISRGGEPVLAVGAHQKNTVAASIGPQVFISQHIGDLDTPQAIDAFERVIASFARLYEHQPATIACDLHSDYASTQWARRHSERVVGVQHHYAHVLSCMAERRIEAPVLGVAWDGSGYGPDGTIWGGEFLRVEPEGYTRFGHFRAFGLPGGSKAVREPRRVALSLLFELFGSSVAQMDDLEPLRAFASAERSTLVRMIERRINAPRTSSVGRLFDGVASMIGIRQVTSFEGQAAMELEYSIEPTDDAYPIEVKRGEPAVIDWAPMLSALVADVRSGVPRGMIAARFHNGLAESIVTTASIAGEQTVVLSGGCFQNRYLLERAVARLHAAGFLPVWHQLLPPNDGGIALGQLYAVLRTGEDPASCA